MALNRAILHYYIQFPDGSSSIIGSRVCIYIYNILVFLTFSVMIANPKKQLILLHVTFNMSCHVHFIPIGVCILIGPW